MPPTPKFILVPQPLLLRAIRALRYKAQHEGNGYKNSVDWADANALKKLVDEAKASPGV